MKKIAVMYICTGKYEKFWDEFYSSCEKHFYPDVHKDYFVFTESNRILTEKHPNVFVYYQVKTGWPYDTLLRFQWFESVHDRWQDYDYCYYFNANSVVIADVDESLIPLPNADKPLIFWCHTMHYDDSEGKTFHPERNLNSTAYVAEGEPCRCYGGGFFGGTGSAFHVMCTTLRDRIQTDLTNGIIAVWHDQSHIIKYGREVPHIEVARDLICQEEKDPVLGKCLIIFKAKDKNGGVDNLRGNGNKSRFRHIVVKVYSKMLDVTSKIGMDRVLRKIASVFSNRRKWYR